MSSASAVRLSPSVQKQKLKLELLRGSRLKLESLPVSVVVHEHLVRAGCMFFGTATRRTLTRLHRRTISSLPRSTTTPIHHFVQYAKVTLLEISPCQGPIVKRSGVAYSCSYALLVIRDWCTRVQGHPRNLFRRPWNFGLSSLRHHT